MQDMGASVSVIIPVYNAGAYLPASLDSIFEGAYQDFHIFLCDDKSSDDTLDVARRYQERYGKMTIAANERNRGACYTRNRLLDMADGKYIAFHDGDDLMTPDRLQTQVEFLERNPDIDVMGGQLYRFTDDHKRAAVSWRFPLTDGDIKICWAFSQALTITTTTMRRECLKIVGKYFDEAYKVADDYEFFSRLVSRARCTNIDAPLEFYREHAVSLTKRLPDLLITNHVKVAKRYLHSYFNIDAQDDVISILSFPQNHPPRSVSKDQSSRLLRLVVALLNTDLVRNGEVTDNRQRYILLRGFTYFNRIPIRKSSLTDLSPSITANKALWSGKRNHILWYILCSLVITRLWRLRSVRQVIWKRKYRRGRNK